MRSTHRTANARRCAHMHATARREACDAKDCHWGTAALPLSSRMQLGFGGAAEPRETRTPLQTPLAICCCYPATAPLHITCGMHGHQPVRPWTTALGCASALVLPTTEPRRHCVLPLPWPSVCGPGLGRRAALLLRAAAPAPRQCPCLTTVCRIKHTVRNMSSCASCLHHLHALPSCSGIPWSH